MINIGCNTASLVAVGSPRSPPSSTGSLASQVPSFDSTFGLERCGGGCNSPGLYSPSGQSVLPLPSTMERSEAVLASNSTNDLYQHQPPVLYHPEASRETDADDYPLSLTTLIGGGSGVQTDADQFPVSGHETTVSLKGSFSTVVLDEIGLQYADSPHHHHHHHHHHSRHSSHQENLVQLSPNHQSSRSFSREPMLVGNSLHSVDPVVEATNEVLADSPLELIQHSQSALGLSRMSLPNQSPMHGADFIPAHIQNHRRMSSSSFAGSIQTPTNIYPGHLLETVLSPLAETAGCHPHQPYSWYSSNNADVALVDHPLLQSPVTGLFPFPSPSVHCDPSAFPFFTHPSSVNSSIQRFNPHQPHQQYPQHSINIHQPDFSPGQSIHHQPYLNLNLSIPPLSRNDMPQNSFTGFASTGHQAQQKQQTRRGGRRPKEEQQHVSPEEEEKRKQRRMRNKEAAARCRKRRLDHMTLLSGQVSELQGTQVMLEREIEQLAKEKEELEFILKTHEPVCRLRGQLPSFRDQLASAKKANTNLNSKPAGITVTPMIMNSKPSFVPVKMEDTGMDYDDKSVSDPPLSSANGTKIMKLSTSISSTSSTGAWNSMTTSINRPDTLSFRMTGEMDSPGIPIQTPSKIFAYDPMNGLNMPTGLTPITSTGLTPILSMANAAATLETPTTSVMGSLESAGTSGEPSNQHKALQPL